MSHIVRFSRRALTQLDELETTIADTGSPNVAKRYVDSIVDYCEGLQTFPKRGTRRDDIRAGLRLIGYRRRVTIAVAVMDRIVEVVGIFYGGQDVEAALRDEQES